MIDRGAEGGGRAVRLALAEGAIVLRFAEDGAGAATADLGPGRPLTARCAIDAMVDDALFLRGCAAAVGAGADDGRDRAR